MSQDILNLNKTTKSILKNPDPKASLAYSNSILRKDPTRVNTEGIGLNPNVPLEDEYIQNLQKQIHFMDLEIKLMKEKQAQEEALGGNYQFAKIGIADGKPSMDHVLATTNKVKQMKLDLTKQVNLLDHDLMKKKEENTIAEAKLANLAGHVEEYDKKLGKILAENTDALTQIRMKLLTEKKQREDVEIESIKLKKVMDKVLDDNEKLRKETELRDLHQRIVQVAFEEDEKFDHENIVAKVKLIDDLQMEKAQLFLVTEKDPRLQALREENEDLQKKVKEAEKKLDNINYRVLETETLQALSVKKKDEDQDQRRKLQAEAEKWKDQLDETLKANELKVERKIREAESPMLKELQADLLKEKHELTDLKLKLEAVYKKEKEYIVDQANRSRYRADLEKKKEANKEIVKELDHALKDLDPAVIELTEKVAALKLKTVEAREVRAKEQEKLTVVEEENIVLLSRFQFLQKNVKIEDDMKKFNIDELRNLIQTNQTVNATIADFMDKWDTLRKFSKIP